MAFAMLAAVGLAGCGPSSNASSSGVDAEARAMAAAADKAAAGGSAAATGSGMPDACDVLTPDIAKNVLGPTAALRRKYRPNPHETQCQWGAKGGAITIVVGEWKFVDMMASGSKPVPGIGDEAHANFSGLFVRKGGRGLYINSIGGSGEFAGAAAANVEARAAAQERKLAPALLARM